MEPLPTFRYHPDPIASGSIEESDVECLCCGRARGYAYMGPTYAEEDLDESLCPWCIADGSAAEKFEAQFVDEENFSDEIPDKVVEEVTERTPSYSGWQQEVWPTCCNDATAFLTPIGFAEIRRDYPELQGQFMDYIVEELSLDGDDADRMFGALNVDASPTAYLFRCLHCNAAHVHIDFT